jgi:hypothetical protein
MITAILKFAILHNMAEQLTEFFYWPLQRSFFSSREVASSWYWLA